MKNFFIAATLLSTPLASYAAGHAVDNEALVCETTVDSYKTPNFNGISADALRKYSNMMICTAYNHYFTNHIGTENYRDIRNKITRLEYAIGKDDLYGMLQLLNECMDDKLLHGDFVTEWC